MIGDGQELTNEDRKNIIEIVSKESRGTYWYILKTQVLKWKKAQESRKKILLSNYLKNGDAREYNKCLDAISYLDSFLNINEIVIDSNKTILDRIKDDVTKILRKSESFVSSAFKNGGVK